MIYPTLSQPNSTLDENLTLDARYEPTLSQPNPAPDEDLTLDAHSTPTPTTQTADTPNPAQPNDSSEIPPIQVSQRQETVPSKMARTRGTNMGT